jgi:hypothetical protein
MQPASCSELAGERIFAPNLQATSIVSPTVQVDQATGTVTVTGGFTAFTQDNIGMDASGIMSVNGGIPPTSSQLYVIEGHVYVNIQPVPFPATWSACEPSSCSDDSNNCAVATVSQSSYSHDDEMSTNGSESESKNGVFKSTSSESCKCDKCTNSRSKSESKGTIVSGSTGSVISSGSFSSSSCEDTRSCLCETCVRKRSSSSSSSKKRYESEIQVPRFSSETSLDGSTSSK